MPRFLRIWIYTALVIFLLSSLTLVVMAATRPRTLPSSASSAEAFADVGFGAFNLVAQDNRPVNQDVFNGKVSIVDFVFTHCQLACPRMSLEMARLTKQLGDTPVQFVSFSLDPKRDTPEKLGAWAADWANKAEGSTERWMLLTEPPGQSKGLGIVRTMLSQDLKLYVEDDPARPITLENGETMSNIFHPVDFFLVGPDGKIVGRFGSTRPEELQELAETARALCESLSSSNPASRPGALSPAAK
ncbi:MAG: SCO family protein [Phycisphaerales bacterium]